MYGNARKHLPLVLLVVSVLVIASSFLMALLTADLLYLASFVIGVFLFTGACVLRMSLEDAVREVPDGDSKSPEGHMRGPFRGLEATRKGKGIP